MKKSPWWVMALIVILTIVAGVIALPPQLPLTLGWGDQARQIVLQQPVFRWQSQGQPQELRFDLKQGLDIQGGMQVILQADMSQIEATDRPTALAAAKDIIQRRVDLFGVNEPVVQTAQQGEQYRIIVELAGIDDPNQALQLVGTTAELDFRLQSASRSAELGAAATESAIAFFSSFEPTNLSGKHLKRASTQFDQQTGEPVVSLEFDDEGRAMFADITSQHIGETLAIFVDGFPVTIPRINTAILDGRAVITGGFTLDQAKQLAIQLNAGALPVPVTVLEQRTIGASLGQDSVRASLQAGVVGVVLVMIFMMLNYGLKGVLATIALSIYAVTTIAIYKILGVTLTLPGIAGLLLSVGMAVDSNILIFERMKEELRLGKSFSQAMELGFGRAWDSIKDANVVTIMTALILVNPFELPFLNTSGLVRGFGVTLLIGVIISLYTGIVVTRTLMRLFLKGSK